MSFQNSNFNTNLEIKVYRSLELFINLTKRLVPSDELLNEESLNNKRFRKEYLEKIGDFLQEYIIGNLY